MTTFYDLAKPGFGCAGHLVIYGYQTIGLRQLQHEFNPRMDEDFVQEHERDFAELTDIDTMAQL